MSLVALLAAVFSAAVGLWMFRPELNRAVRRLRPGESQTGTDLVRGGSGESSGAGPPGAATIAPAAPSVSNDYGRRTGASSGSKGRRVGTAPPRLEARTPGDDVTGPNRKPAGAKKWIGGLQKDYLELKFGM